MPVRKNDGQPLSPEAMKEIIERFEAARRRAEASVVDDSPSAFERTGHHEASHAVMAVRMGIPFEYVAMSIYQDIAKPGDIIGGLHLTPEFARLLACDPAIADDRRKLEQLMLVVLAGEAGQALLEQRPCNIRLGSAQGDYEIALKLARKLYPDPADSLAFIEQQTRVACEMVAEPLCTRQIECVAGQMHTPLELSYAQVVEWMEFAALHVGDSEEAECVATRKTTSCNDASEARTQHFDHQPQGVV